MTRIGKKRKLGPRYIGPFTIVKKIGEVAYKLALPPSMSRIHDVFHLSQLKKFYRESDDKPNPLIVPVSEVNLEEDLTFPAKPVKVLDTQERLLRWKRIPMVKILWKGHKGTKESWETEAEMRQRFPSLFENTG